MDERNSGGPSVDLLDLFSLEEIQKMQDAFASATAVASIITDPQGRPLTQPSNFCRLCRDVIRRTKRGLANCIRSDALLGPPDPSGPVARPCLSCGLWHAGASIFAGDRHVANWLIGQVRNEDLDEQRIEAYARQIGANEEEFRQALAEVTVMSTRQFEAVCRALFLMANQMSQVAYQNIQLARHIDARQLAEEERARLEAQLRQAQKMEAVGHLAGGVAHDFNNILTGILASAELALDDMKSGRAAGEELAADLGSIVEAAQRAAGLTRQLLTFSRRQVSRPQVLDLRGTLGGLESMLRRLLAENIELTMVLDPETPCVLADPNQIEQVVLNLAVNARDAMPEGGRLSVETAPLVIGASDAAVHPDASPGRYALLCLSDSGSGMDAATQEHAFEPFFTTKDMGHGTGLGLATVYGIVRQAGGYVALHSAPQQGTAVRVFLPAVDADPAAAGAAPAPAAGDEAPCGDETLLLCEDDEAVRRLTGNVLRSAGYQVLAAADGQEALQLAARHGDGIRLLVTDVIMPDMNGRALSEALRGVLPGLHTLFVSGYTADVIAHHGVLDPGVEFLEKPFTRRDLLGRVRAILDA